MIKMTRITQRLNAEAQEMFNEIERNLGKAGQDMFDAAISTNVMGDKDPVEIVAQGAYRLSEEQRLYLAMALIERQMVNVDDKDKSARVDPIVQLCKTLTNTEVGSEVGELYGKLGNLAAAPNGPGQGMAMIGISATVARIREREDGYTHRFFRLDEFEGLVERVLIHAVLNGADGLDETNMFFACEALASVSSSQATVNLFTQVSNDTRRSNEVRGAARKGLDAIEQSRESVTEIEPGSSELIEVIGTARPPPVPLTAIKEIDFEDLGVEEIGEEAKPLPPPPKALTRKPPSIPQPGTPVRRGQRLRFGAQPPPTPGSGPRSGPRKKVFGR